VDGGREFVRAAVAAVAPLKRIGQPHDVAEVVLAWPARRT